MTECVLLASFVAAELYPRPVMLNCVYVSTKDRKPWTEGLAGYCMYGNGYPVPRRSARDGREENCIS